MPLSTEGLIEEIKRFRSDKLALVALVGSMGAESEADALERLREVKAIAAENLTRVRRLPVAERRKEYLAESLWRGVWELAGEIEPWLAQVADRAPLSRPGGSVSEALATTPQEKLEAVREWVEKGIAATLEEDPSGFLLGIESVSILEALEDVAAALAKPGVP